MALVEEKSGGSMQGQAAPPADQQASRDVRYDPVILKAGVASFDWRNNAPANALGIPRPAVQEGQIDFFEPFPGVPRLCTFKQGGGAPFQCTLFQMRIDIEAPHERSWAIIAAVQEVVVPRGVQLAEVLGRADLTLNVNTVPQFQNIPVQDIGAAGGIVVAGAPQSGSGLNRGTEWNHGFPLPEPLTMSTTDPKLDANIKMMNIDLPYLGVAGGLGVGAPMFTDRYIDAAGALQVCGAAPSVLPTIVYLKFFGQRGLWIKSGQIPSPPGFPCFFPGYAPQA